MSTNKTTNLQMHSWVDSDFFSVNELNENFTKLDGEVVKRATTSADGRMSNTDKAKLDGIQTGAQVNAVTSVQGRTGAVTIGVADLPKATTSADGTMSKEDKTKLDGIQGGAQVNAVTSVQGRTGAVNITLAELGGATSSHVHANATTTTDGFLSSADKLKLDGIQAGAQPQAVSSVQGRTGAVTITLAELGGSPTSHTHTNATTSAHGFMASTDKAKLDGIQNGAQVNAVTTVAGRTGAVVLNGSDISATGGTTVQAEIDSLKSSVSSGKITVRNAITDKGGTVANSSNPSFQDLANGITGIKTGYGLGDIVPDSSLSAYTSTVVTEWLNLTSTPLDIWWGNYTGDISASSTNTLFIAQTNGVIQEYTCTTSTQTLVNSRDVTSKITGSITAIFKFSSHVLGSNYSKWFAIATRSGTTNYLYMYNIQHDVIRLLGSVPNQTLAWTYIGYVINTNPYIQVHYAQDTIVTNSDTVNVVANQQIRVDNDSSTGLNVFGSFQTNTIASLIPSNIKNETATYGTTAIWYPMVNGCFFSRSTWSSSQGQWNRWYGFFSPGLQALSYVTSQGSTLGHWDRSYTSIDTATIYLGWNANTGMNLNESYTVVSSSTSRNTWQTNKHHIEILKGRGFTNEFVNIDGYIGSKQYWTNSTPQTIRDDLVIQGQIPISVDTKFSVNGGLRSIVDKATTGWIYKIVYSVGTKVYRWTNNSGKLIKQI